MPKRRGGWTLVDWLKAGILGAAALGISWLVIVVSVPRALPEAVLTRLNFDIGAPRLVYRDASEEMIANRGRISDDTFDRVRAAWLRDPMAGEPFFFAGMRALLSNDLPGAERLLREARARDPRLGQARLALVALYLKTGRVAPAADEIDIVSRLVPRASEVLVPELAEVVGDPRTRPVLVAAIGDRPLMTLLLDHLATKETDPEMMLALAARQPAAQDGQFRPWQAKVVEQFVARGDVARARDLWRRFSGVSEDAGTLVYDPDFRGLPGGPPFNWQLAADGSAAVDRAQGGGLEVEYFGRRSAAIASQLLTLEPGGYRLRLQAEGNANGQGSRLAWRLACASGRVLLELPLTDITFNPKVIEGRFAIPSSECAAQTLALIGTAGEFPSRQIVQTSGLSLEGGGASR